MKLIVCLTLAAAFSLQAQSIRFAPQTKIKKHVVSTALVSIHAAPGSILAIAQVFDAAMQGGIIPLEQVSTLADLSQSDKTGAWNMAIIGGQYLSKDLPPILLALQTIKVNIPLAGGIMAAGQAVSAALGYVKGIAPSDRASRITSALLPVLISIPSSGWVSGLIFVSGDPTWKSFSVDIK